MRRLLLLVCVLLAACSAPPPENNDSAAPQNPPTLTAPAQFVEAEQAITLNNVSSLKYLGRLDQPDTLSTVFGDAVSPDATRLVGLDNEELLGWNLVNGKMLFQTARNDATRIFYSSDKTEVYGIDINGLTTVFDTNTGAVKTTFQGSSNYSTVAAFSSDSGWLALGGNDGTVKVWDTYQRQALVTLNAETSAISALAFSADGTQLATASGDGSVRLWHWQDRKLLNETKLDTPIVIQPLAFAPEGGFIAIGTNRDARLWAQSPQQVYVLDTGHGGGSQILQFSPDGRYLLTGNQSAGLSLWNLASGTLAARLPDTSGDTLSAAFSPDGNLLVTSVMNGKIALWNLVQITAQTVNEAQLQVGTQQVLRVEWTNDSRLILFFDATGPVYLWGIGA